MNINLNNYKQLPDSIIDRNLQRDAGKEITKKINEIKTHWQALKAIPEISEQMQDINAALDEDSINDNIEEQMQSLRALPLPPREKEKCVEEWQKLKDKIDYHRSALIAAMDFFPDGYVQIEGNSVESVSITLEDKEELEVSQATIATPGACKALYEHFLKVVKEIQAFEDWQAESGFKCRSFFDMVCYYPTAESIARAFLGGAWNK